MDSNGRRGRDDPRQSTVRANPRPAWLSAASAARYIDVSIGTIGNLTRRGMLRAHSVPGTSLRRYRRSDLDVLLEHGVSASAAVARRPEARRKNDSGGPDADGSSS